MSDENLTVPKVKRKYTKKEGVKYGRPKKKIECNNLPPITEKDGEIA